MSRRQVLRWSGGLAASAAILAVAALLATYLVRTKPAPAEASGGVPGRLVTAFLPRPRSHRVAMTAYGTSQPGREWSAIAETAGRAVWVHPEFKAGQLLQAETTIVRLDRSQLELKVRRLEAEIRTRWLERRKLAQQLEDDRELVQLAARQAELAQAAYDRGRRIQLPQAEIDLAEREWLAQKAAHQQIRDKIDLNAIESRRLSATITLARAELAEAEEDLQKTEIKLPFTGICAVQGIESHQHVALGQTLGRFVSIDVAEVEVMLEIRKGYMLWPRGEPLSARFDARNPVVLELLKHLEIPAEVRPVSHPKAVFQGRVSRARFTDPDSRAAPLVVEVAEPFRDAQLGVRPPLTPNMFCEVTLYGAQLDGVYVVPRDAIRDNRLYLVREGRLHIQPISPLVLQRDTAVLDRGIQDGDYVVLGPLFPASEGMPLRVHEVPNPASRPVSTEPLSESGGEVEPAAGDARQSTDGALRPATP